MPSFVVNCRYVLLTYPQCEGLDEWAVNNHLSSLGCECIIGREDHADGGTHLHAFCDFGKKFRSRRVDIFDVDGRHPNIVPSRGSPERGYDYAIKDGHVVAGGLARPSVNATNGDGSKWSEIIGAESEREFWENVERLDPKALCTNFGNLRKFADWRYKTEPERYEHPEGISFSLGMVPELVSWREQSLGDVVEGKASASLRGFKNSSVGWLCSVAPRGVPLDPPPSALSQLECLLTKLRQTPIIGSIWTH